MRYASPSRHVLQCILLRITGFVCCPGGLIFSLLRPEPSPWTYIASSERDQGSSWIDLGQNPASTRSKDEGTLHCPAYTPWIVLDPAPIDRSSALGRNVQLEGIGPRLGGIGNIPRPNGVFIFRSLPSPSPCPRLRDLQASGPTPAYPHHAQNCAIGWSRRRRNYEVYLRSHEPCAKTPERKLVITARTHGGSATGGFVSLK